MRCLTFVLLLAFCSLPAVAQITKYMEVCEHGLCPYFRAPLAPPEGWVSGDPGPGRAREMQLFLPEGESFDSAPAVIYATVTWNAEDKSLDALIADEIARWRDKNPDAQAEEVPSLGLFRVFALRTPGAGANPFEYVAYALDHDGDGNVYFLVVVVSALTAEALDAARGAYEDLLRNYRPPPFRPSA